MGEIDCVVIDEFQDTNPVQFALLWRLARHAPRCLIVGDTKQAIMGFQGADPRLSEALNASLPEAVEPLTRNWRSSPPIMDLVNTLGPALFGEGYIPLAPQRPDPGLDWLEVIHLPKPKDCPPQHAIAARIHEMLARAEIVTDRHTGQPRPVRPDDIAVLLYRTDKGVAQAAALRDLGLPVRITAEGWRSSLATRVAGHALAVAPTRMTVTPRWPSSPSGRPACRCRTR